MIHTRTSVWSLVFICPVSPVRVTAIWCKNNQQKNPKQSVSNWSPLVLQLQKHLLDPVWLTGGDRSYVWDLWSLTTQTHTHTTFIIVPLLLFCFPCVIPFYFPNVLWLAIKGTKSSNISDICSGVCIEDYIWYSEILVFIKEIDTKRGKCAVSLYWNCFSAV